MRLRILNFTCIFNVFQIALVASNSANFVKTLKILLKLILNCPWAHSITYTFNMSCEATSVEIREFFCSNPSEALFQSIAQIIFLVYSEQKNTPIFLNFLAGLDRQVAKFFIFTFTLILTNLCACSVGSGLVHAYGRSL